LQQTGKDKNDECELHNKEQTIHFIQRKRFGIKGTMLTDFVYALCPCLENKNDDNAVFPVKGESESVLERSK